MNEEPILEAKEIHKVFYHPTKVVVLSNVNLRIQPRETISITGPSGSGKSTLLHILGTLESPTSGDLFFQGKKIKSSQTALIRNKRIGFVFQSGNLLEEYSLIDNLLIKARIGRRQSNKGSLAYKEALELLDRVGLSHRINFPVKYLSGGEKQRASIARAFMNDPDLILADEPTGNLDSIQAANVQEILIHCCKDLNKSLVVVTHDDHFASLCDHKFQLEGGTLTEDLSFTQSL